MFSSALPTITEPVIIDGYTLDTFNALLFGGNRIIRVTGQSEHITRRVLDFLKREAKKVLEARAFYYADQLGTAPKHITVRDTASRWGSCSTQRSLSFSWRLILAPAFVLDYVVAHEVAHMREMNHGPRFWRLVEDLVGDVERPQVWLREKGSALHRYMPKIDGGRVVR